MPRDARAETPFWQGLVRRGRSFRVVVRDDSMFPTLRPGDRLYVDPRPGRPFARGDLVVAPDPAEPHRLLVKRVAALEGDEPIPGHPVPEGRVFLVGDHREASRDSRAFGPVPVEALVGLAWYRYAPSDRRGTLPATLK